MTRTLFAGELATMTRGLAQSAPAGTMDSNTFMAKALHANAEGRLSSVELAELKKDIARDRQPRIDLVKAVIAGGPAVSEAGAPMNKREFMAKSMDMLDQGKLTGRDITEIEQSLNSGRRVTARLVRAVESGRKPELW